MPRPDRLAKQLVQASCELIRREPWNALVSDAFFLVTVPTEEHPLAAVMTGRDGIESGITLSRGAEGLARALRLIYTDGPDGRPLPELRERWDHIALHIEPLGSIPPAFRGYLERAGFQGRRESPAPLVYGKRPGDVARPPTRQEVRTLLWCLAGVFTAMDAGDLDPAPVARGQPLRRLDVGGTLDRPDVQVRSVPWQEALGDADQFADVPLPGDAAPSTPRPLEDPPIEDPQSLEEWKAANEHFVSFMSSRILGDDGAHGSRAFRRYFGTDREGDAVLAELERLCPLVAYTEWLAADYRPTYRSRTWLEKLLRARGTPPVHRAIARARLEADHSIYRVDRTHPGSSLELEDVYSGRRHTAHDQLLSAAPLEGLFIPLRLVTLGEWTVPVLAGPPLTTMQIDQAMRWLDGEGLLPNATTLRPQAELLGRLWVWYLYRGRLVPELQNTDGDPLLWHTASYAVGDPAALVAALEARGDVVCDREGSEWTWLRGGDGPVRLGETISLCRLELLGDELIVEANSRRRIDDARSWVEGLPGVRFLAQSMRDVGGAVADRPLDDRLPKPPEPPMPPEVVAEMRRLIDERHRAWLDESIPALGGQTPRQAAADPTGRRLVERLIRTMSAVHVPGGRIEPRRQDLLDELGLGDDPHLPGAASEGGG